MDDVDELIDRCRAKLGEPDGVYRPGPVLPGLLKGAGLVAAGLVILGVVLVLRAKALGALGKFLFALPVVGGLLIYNTLVSRGRAVLTYPDGLLPVGRGEVAWLPWDGVGAVHLRAKAATRAADHLAVEPPGLLQSQAKLTVHRGDDGPPVEVRPALIGYAELAGRVQRETFARRWPGVLSRFEAGETVGFGEFDLHRDGLSKGSKTLAWDRVKGVELKHGRVVVKKRGKWLSWAAVGLEEVADPHLFFALADHARAAAAADTGDSESDSPSDPDGV